MPSWKNDPFFSGGGKQAAAASSPWKTDPFFAGGKVPAKAPTASPAPNHGTVGTVGDFLSAVGHHVGNAVHGAAQLVENGIDSGMQLLPDNPVSRYVHQAAQNDNRVLAQRERQYQAATPTNVASVAGAGIGEALPFVVGGATRGLRAAGDMASAIGSKIPRIGAVAAPVADSATQGAILGAAAPVTDSGSYWQNKAKQVGGNAALGAGIGGMFGLGQVGVNAWRNNITPLTNPNLVAGRTLNNVLAPAYGGTDALIQRLKAAKQIVPGSIPTVAQAAPTPQAVMLEKALFQRPGAASAWNQRLADNNAARWDAINSVAKTPAELDQAVANRSDTVSPLYDAASSEAYVPTPTLTTILGTPAGQSVMQRATTLAANDRIGLPLVNEMGDLTGYGAHYLKMGFDAMLDEGKKTGMAGAEQNAIRDLRGDYLGWLEDQSPAYARARQAYREASIPVNDMAAGQSIVADLASRGANAAGDPTIQLSGYRSALAKSLKNSEFGVSPYAQQTLQSVQDDLQRASISNSMASAPGGGSATFSNMGADDWLMSHLGGDSSQNPWAKYIAGAVGTVVPGVGTMGGYLGMRDLQQKGVDKATQALANALLNPDQAASVMQAAQPSQNTNMLINALRGVPLLPAVGSASAQQIP